MILQQAYVFVRFYPNLTVREVEINTKMSTPSALDLDRSHRSIRFDLVSTLEDSWHTGRHMPLGENPTFSDISDAFVQGEQSKQSKGHIYDGTPAAHNTQ